MVHGTVAAVSGTSLTIDSEDGPFTANLSSSTAVSLGHATLAVSDLSPGQTVDARYASQNQTVVVTRIRIQPQSLRGTVTQVSSPTSFTVTTPEGTPVNVTLAPSAQMNVSGVTGSVTVSEQITAMGLDQSGDAFLAFSAHAKAPEPTILNGTITEVVGSTLTIMATGDHRFGVPVTVTLTANTKVRVQSRTMSAKILAMGERARIRAVPDSQTAGQLDAQEIWLMPGRLRGVIQSVNTQGNDTVLTVYAMGDLPMPGTKPPGKPEYKANRGQRHAMPIRLAQVYVLPDTHVRGVNTSASTPLQSGEWVNVFGSWATSGLMAASVFVMPQHPIVHPQQGEKGHSRHKDHGRG
jgi:hypothetical protein